MNDPIANVFSWLTYESGDFDVQIGDLVLVPFGPQKRRGIVIALERDGAFWEDEFDANGRKIAIRKISSLIEVGFVTPYQLSLIDVVVDSCQCTYFQAMKLCLPMSIWKGEYKQVYSEYIVSVVDGDVGRAAKQRELLDSLLLLFDPSSEQLVVSEALERCGVGNRTLLKELVTKNLVVVEKRARSRSMVSSYIQEAEKEVALSSLQSEVIDRVVSNVRSGAGVMHVLEGVTGSGKTEVYMQIARQLIDDGRQLVMLVPEIALTPQTVQRFVDRFGHDVVLWHSRLSAGEKMDEWMRVKKGKVKIVIGSRSAMFLPLSNVGVVIVDEEHDTSYKQGSTPRYHVRTVLQALTSQMGASSEGVLSEGGLCSLLGSATPSVESYHLISQERAELLRLPDRISGALPSLHLVDMIAEKQGKNYSIFSNLLQQEIARTLVSKQQAILFLNRRGAARVIQCQECGWESVCEACDIPHVVHRFKTRGADGVVRDVQKLVCHLCSRSIPAPVSCAKCDSLDILDRGVGTQRVEAEVCAMWPHARVLRMDRDTTTGKHDHENLYRAFRDGEYDILIGTQMIAKGIDIPAVNLIGVIHSDVGMHMPDFRASERVSQLLLQVSGRAGRGDTPGKCVFQTYSASNHLLSYVTSYSYDAFIASELEQREKFGYPPFVPLTKLRLTGKDYVKLLAWSEDVCTTLRATYPASEIDILGPVMAWQPKLDNEYRVNIFIKGKAPDLRTTLAAEMNRGLTFDIDPYDLS